MNQRPEKHNDDLKSEFVLPHPALLSRLPKPEDFIVENYFGASMDVRSRDLD